MRPFLACALLLAVAIFLFLIACEISPPTAVVDGRLLLSPAQVWPLHVGETRTFVNLRQWKDPATGAVLSSRIAGRSYMTTESAGALACAPLAFSVLISKDPECTECYWGPTGTQQDHFIVGVGADGALNAYADLHQDIVTLQPKITIDFHLQDGSPFPLLVPGIRDGLVVKKIYSHLAQGGVNRTDCLSTSDAPIAGSYVQPFGVGGQETLEYSFGSVATPGYKGPALIVHYSEGAPDGTYAAGDFWPGSTIPHAINDSETWYFALRPPYGIVQIVNESLGAASPPLQFDGVHLETLVVQLERAN